MASNSQMATGEAKRKAALVVAHPGHELCVYGWLETSRPLVFVLTDGTGRSGISRLDSTTKILATAGSIPGAIYGRHSDLDLYAAILHGDFRLFEKLCAELAETLVEEEIEYVAGDAIEGYNPTHDVCRLLIDAAVERANRLYDRRIVNRDFLLFGRHNNIPEELRQSAIWVTLDQDGLERKLALARAYPELKSEIEALLDNEALEALRAFPELSAHIMKVVTSGMGKDAYQVECLRLVRTQAWNHPPFHDVPFYERYGELLVAAGIYHATIRHREHFVPLSKAIQHFAEKEH